MQEDACAHCEGALYLSEDDQPETIRVRMSACHESILPVIKYDRQWGLLISIKADGVPMAKFQRTLPVEKEKHA